VILLDLLQLITFRIFKFMSISKKGSTKISVSAIVALLTLCSCGQKNEEQKSEPIVENKITRDSVIGTESPKQTQAEDYLAWGKHQDSLRTEILKTKTNAVLKNSFLQEFYIRNVADVNLDIVSLNLSFNLHNPDCGAPDCYSTDVSFGFKLGDSLVFPKNLQFLESVNGCVDKETNLKGEFALQEQTKDFVIYYCRKPKRTLVLFSYNSENGTSAWYFTGLERKKINGKNLNTILSSFDEDDKNALYPFMSRALTSNEYENFLE
jgi:hypothetical protein